MSAQPVSVEEFENTQVIFLQSKVQVIFIAVVWKFIR